MNDYVATVTAKGQVTIPKRVREALSIAEQDRLLFVIEDDRLIVIPLRHARLGDLRGALPATRPFPGHDAIRAEIRAAGGSGHDDEERA